MNRNEAIKLVREYYPDGRRQLLNEALETLIPELKEKENESEGEKIRKALISILKSDFDKDTTIYGISVGDIIAWLEKQVIDISSFPNEEQKYMEKYTSLDKVTLIKLLAERDRNVEEITKSFEKQCEQRHLAFKAEHGRYYYCIKNYFSGGKKQASKGDVVQALRGLPIMGLEDASEFFLPVNDMQLNKLNNAINHNDRPKFKVGDWIVYDKYNNKDIDRIVKLDNELVRFESGEWLYNYQLNKDCKLWTIKDAEGGDVLSCENGWTCIFKALDNHTNTFSSYCFMDKKGWFCECGGQGHTLDDRICGKIHPATKEQRDLLFKKMKEAGYEWDAEQKELKKIEIKFKVGDWVVTEEGKVNQVTTVSDDGDAYTLDDGTYFSGSWKDMYHLWTIEDAKDGDVLAEHETIVLFKKIEGLNIRCYCTYHYLGYNPALYVDTLQNKTPYRPATKEQRDLLFQKMGEEGYEWDAKNKILTKIEKVSTPKYKAGDWLICDDFAPMRVDCIDLKEQKYYLSNGDIRPSEMVDNNPYIRLWSIRDAKSGDVLYNYEGENGVEAIHLVKGWEDVKDMGKTLCSIATYRVLDNEVISGGLGAIWWEGNTVKFRPATTEERKKLFKKANFLEKKQINWKPTKEQLRQLDAAVAAYAKGSKTHTELHSLSEDLKKLN